MFGRFQVSRLVNRTNVVIVDYELPSIDDRTYLNFSSPISHDFYAFMLIIREIIKSFTCTVDASSVRSLCTPSHNEDGSSKLLSDTLLCNRSHYECMSVVYNMFY